MDGAGGDTRTGPFRPEAFFAGRTEGWGVARGPTGRILRRCRLVTDGQVEDTYRTISFDETFHWEDGETDLWRWVMTRGLKGHYVAAEVRAGAGIHGRHEGSDYLLSFHRALRPEGGPRARFHTRFTPISPEVTLKIVRVSLMGLPIGGLTAFHQRVA